MDAMKLRDLVAAKTGDATVPRPFLDDDENTPGHIEVTIPYWIYRRVWSALVAMGASTKTTS
jgi:hypothetical protein